MFNSRTKGLKIQSIDVPYKLTLPRLVRDCPVSDSGLSVKAGVVSGNCRTVSWQAVSPHRQSIGLRISGDMYRTVRQPCPVSDLEVLLSKRFTAIRFA